MINERNEIRKDLKLFNEIVEELLNLEVEQPVSPVIAPEKLFDEMDLHLNEEPLDDDQFKASLKDLVFKTPKTSSNRFFNQLFGGRQSKAYLGDLLAVMLNNSMYTYKVGGPQIGIEKEIINQISTRVGYASGSGGTIGAGGSMNNFMAMIMARDAQNNSIKNDGVRDHLVAYTSKESHYSVAKNGTFAGIGRDNIRYINSDERGAMLASDLELKITQDLKDGLKPFFVNVTTGTTVLGVADPIEELSKVCKKHNVWLHVDGAYCGAVLFSKKYRKLLKGVELSDSFAFNAHKMLGTPLSCSIIVVKDKRDLNYSFSNEASYLYQDHGDDFNPGKTSFQCGRRNDALKFWSLWKAVGTSGLEKIVDHQFHLADTARDYIRSNSDYTLYSGDDSVSICFNYKNIDPKVLCNSLYDHEELVVGFGEFDGTFFVRLVTVNASNTDEDLLNFFKIMEKFVDSNPQIFNSTENLVVQTN